MNDSNDRIESLIEKINQLTEIGVALSIERDINKLLRLIVEKACQFANADAGTLYIKEDNALTIKVFLNKTLSTGTTANQDKSTTLLPVELKESNISGYAALRDVCVNIPDVYDEEFFDFTGPKEYDAHTNYHTKSMLAVPMRNHEDDVIGVLQLINAMDFDSGEIIPFSAEIENLTHSLASQAAVAITNTQLIESTENLFNSLVDVLATAIDEKSPVTAGHIRKVAVLTMAMAQIINSKNIGPFKDIHFSRDELHELKISALMHDIGKVTTPVHIIEKGRKLETIFDRIQLLNIRLLYHAKNIENEGLKKQMRAMQEDATEETIDKIMRDTEQSIQEVIELDKFLHDCNEPSEYMDDEKLARLKAAAELTYSHNGETRKLINEDEFKNLSIRKGSITDDELQIMRDHISITIKMLEQIPFIKKLQQVPAIAATHHEYIDGTGYPFGLSGDEITLAGRILAVTDIAEALTATDRPYKKPMPIEQVHKILKAMAENGQLDADLVELFIECDVYGHYQKALANNDDLDDIQIQIN